MKGSITGQLGILIFVLQALFFDFDGLVLDTESPEVYAWTEIFADGGHEYPKDYWQFVVGRGPDQLTEKPVERFRRVTGTEESEESIFARFRERYFQLLKKECLPGVLDLLNTAQKQQIPCWIVSSSDQTWVTGHASDLGILHFFEKSITREFAPRSKPSPDLYLKALELSGFDRDRVWVFEDSFNGLTAAKAAGLRCIVCPNFSTQHLDFSAAERVVGSLVEITLDQLD